MSSEGTGAQAPVGRRRSLLVPVVTGLFLLLALVAVAVALRGDWAAWSDLEDEARAYGWRLSSPYLLVALGSGVAALLASGALWAVLFRSAGGRVPIREGVAAWLGSNLGRYLPGKVWQLTSLTAYVRARGDSGATALGVSLVLQAAVLAVGAALALAALGGRAFGDASPWAIGLASVAVALALTPAVLRRVIGWGGKLLREPPSEAASGLDSRRLLGAGLWAVGLWMLHGLGFWALTRGLVADSPVTLTMAAGIFAAGYVVGYVVLLAPGGIIVREGAIAGLLGAAAGIPLGPATAIALAARLWSTAAELVAFAVAAAAGLRGRRETG